MAADSLELLFRLRMDSAQARADIRSLRSEFARELAAIKGLTASAATSFRPSAAASAAPPLGGGTAQGTRAAVSAQNLANAEQRAALGAQRLQVQQQALAATAQRVANAQQQAAAGALRAQTAYTRASQAAANYAASQSALVGVGRTLQGFGRDIASVGSQLAVGITLPLVGLGAAAVRSARQIDAQVNTLKAFTGSAEAAEKRLAQLIETSRRTPGLTTNLAATLDAQLRVAQVTEETIDRILPAIGRINAVQALPDPGRFVNNLVQLVTQSFERQDLKELVGQSPIVGQIVREIFNVDNPTNAQAIRESAQRLGITSVDAFFTAFAQTAARNKGLQNVTESIGTQFSKLVDRVLISLRPLGLAIVDALVPAVNAVVPIIETLGGAFASLPGPLKTVLVLVGGVVAAFGPTLFLFGQLSSGVGLAVTTFVKLNALGILPTLTNLSLLGQVMRGTAGLAAGQAATLAAFSAGWLAVAAAVGIAGFAVYKYFTAQKQFEPVTAAQVQSLHRQVEGYREQARFLDTLKAGVARTSQEQKRLKDIYDQLNLVAPKRVGSIEEETDELKKLRAELERVQRIKGQEQVQQAAGVVADLEANVRANNELNAAIERRTERVTQLTAVLDRLKAAEQPLTRQELEAAGLGFLEGLAEREQQIHAIEQRVRQLTNANAEARTKAENFDEKARAQIATLEVLAKDTGLTEREMLALAHTMGRLPVSVELAERALADFRREQGETKEETKAVTAEVEEQARSLRVLKRALEEAEVAARSRSDAARRAFEEERTSFSQFTKTQIANVRELERAQLAEIDATLEARRKALATLTDGEKKGRAEEEIGELESRRRRIIEESANEIQNLLSQQRQRERDEAERHSDALLAIDRETDEERIDNLRAQFELDESLRLKNERRIVEIERRITDEEIQQIKDRLTAAAAGTEARARLEDELEQKRTAARRQRAEQERRIREAELEDALRPVRRRAAEEDTAGVGEQALIDRLRDSLERRGEAVVGVFDSLNKRTTFTTVKTFRDLENAIKGIVDEGFARRIKLLQDEIDVRRRFGQNVEQQEQEKARLEAERQTAREEGDRRATEGAEADISLRERQIRQAERLVALERAVSGARLAVREAVLNSVRSTFVREVELVNERFNLERERAALALDEELERLRAEERAEVESARQQIKNKAEFEARKKQIEDDYAALRKAAKDREAAEDRAREQERRRQVELQDPTSGRSLFGDVFADAQAAAVEAGAGRMQSAIVGLATTAQQHFAAMSAQAGNFTTMLLGAFDSLVQASAQLLHTWILTGQTGPAVLRKMTAQILAQLATQALVKSLYELAEGFAWLFIAPPKAASHFKAAALYAAAAAAAGLAGRAAAGNLFNQSGTASAAVGAGGRGSEGPFNQTAKDTRAIDLARQPQTQVIEHRHTIQVESNDSHIVKVIHEDVRNLGPTRELIIQTANS